MGCYWDWFRTMLLERYISDDAFGRYTPDNIFRTILSGRHCPDDTCLTIVVGRYLTDDTFRTILFGRYISVPDDTVGR